MKLLSNLHPVIKGIVIGVLYTTVSAIFLSTVATVLYTFFNSSGTPSNVEMIIGIIFLPIILITGYPWTTHLQGFGGNSFFFQFLVMCIGMIINGAILGFLIGLVVSIKLKLKNEK